MATRELSREFAADHRRMTRGLYDLRAALERDDVVAAAEIAKELDRIAGSHTEFEEKVLYPALVEPLGEDFVKRLYSEHEEGQAAVRSLLDLGSEGLSEADKERILEQVDTAIKHALSCGTLLSRVSGLTSDKAQDMLAALREARERGRRWTELGPR
jgi:hemerythrin-like domain-containing protein